MPSRCRYPPKASEPNGPNGFALAALPAIGVRVIGQGSYFEIRSRCIIRENSRKFRHDLRCHVGFGMSRTPQWTRTRFPFARQW